MAVMPQKISRLLIDAISAHVSSVGRRATPQSVGPILDRISHELCAISDSSIRTRGFDLLQRARGNTYVFERDPDSYPDAVRRALADLVSYLEQNAD